MLRAFSCWLAIAFSGSLAYAAPTTGKEPPPVTIWVSHTFIGGPKCVPSGPVSHYQPPGFMDERSRLKSAGVIPVREFHRDLATCEACHKCPNYKREILFEILKEKSAAAAKAGYEKTEPPSTDELNAQ